MRWYWKKTNPDVYRLLLIPPPGVTASKDGRRIALAEAGLVTVWDGTLAHEIARISTLNVSGNVLIALSADGSLLALAGSDQTSVVVWDTATSKPLRTFTVVGAPQLLDVSPGGALTVLNSSGVVQSWPDWVRR